MLEIQEDSFPGVLEIIPALQAISKDMGISFTLVGAGARNLWLQDRSYRTPAATKDADFAVFATGMQEYQALKAAFVQDWGFVESSRNPLTLLSKKGIPVDLLPYGPIASNEEIPLPGFSRAAQVAGLAEACSHAVPISFQGKTVGSIVSFAGLVLLKLIAFDDRPTQRFQDLDDLALIFTHAFEVLEPDIYEHHWDVLDQHEITDLYAHQVGCRVLGRQMAIICASNPSLPQRLLTIIQQHISQGETGPLPKRLEQATVYPTIKAKDGLALLVELQQGVTESPSS